MPKTALCRILKIISPTQPPRTCTSSYCHSKELKILFNLIWYWAVIFDLLTVYI